jgi:hypothetical protein
MVVDDLEAKRRKDVLKDMEKIEKEFADLKDKLYERKIKDLQEECKSIIEGTHEIFLKRVDELEQKRQEKIWLTNKWREYQLQNLEHIYNSELKQADDEFQYEKKHLRDQMANEVLEKQRKLEEEKNTMNLKEVNGETTRATKLRTLRRRGRSAGPPGGSENLNASPYGIPRHRTAPPHINYTLSDDEIFSDLQLLRRKDLSLQERRRLLLEADSFPVPINANQQT